MSKFKCSVCGWIYNEERGDSQGGVAAGTLFADIADDWTCPECGVGKDSFEAEE